MDADRPVDFVPVEFGLPLGNRQIGLFNRPLFKLFSERLVGRIAAGHDNHPAGVTVEPMNDTGAGWPTAGGKPATILLKMPLQSSGKRAPPVALGGMDNHAGRLVDHRHRVVGVQKLERNLLGLWPLPGRLGHGEADRHAGLGLEGCPGGDAIDPYTALLDRPSQIGSAVAGKVPAEELINAASGRLFINGEVNFVTGDGNRPCRRSVQRSFLRCRLSGGL